MLMYQPYDVSSAFIIIYFQLSDPVCWFHFDSHIIYANFNKRIVKGLRLCYI